MLDKIKSFGRKLKGGLMAFFAVMCSLGLAAMVFMFGAVLLYVTVIAIGLSLIFAIGLVTFKHFSKEKTPPEDEEELTPEGTLAFKEGKPHNY